MTRISFEEMKSTILQAFLKAGMPEAKAEVCARIHAESSRDGVYSHGLNRVERFVDYIAKGWVDVNAEPTLERSLGAMEIIYPGEQSLKRRLENMELGIPVDESVWKRVQQLAGRMDGV